MFNKYFRIFLLVLFLGLSSCTNSSSDKGPILDTELLSSTIDSMEKEIEQKYILSDSIAEIVAKLEKKRHSLLKKRGAQEFENSVDKILRSCDKHMSIDFDPEYISYLHSLKNNPELEKASMQKKLESEKRDNFGFGEVNKLNNQIGYIKMTRFCETLDAFNRLGEVMTKLAGSKAIIIDLTQSGGGSPEMVQRMCSYFFSDSVHLNTIYCRFNNETKEFWTLEETPGPKLTDTDLYV